MAAALAAVRRLWEVVTVPVPLTQPELWRSLPPHSEQDFMELEVSMTRTTAPELVFTELLVLVLTVRVMS